MNAAQNPASGHDLVEVAEIFSPKGIVSKAKNFEFRPQQQEMAVAVARALQDGEHLAVEVGTGVGKSLAYLVPAILYGVAHKKKAVVSTHTINLQEQLTQKDLPMLEQILRVKFQFTMLKGRANYLCTRRLHKARQHAPNLFTSSEAEELERIHEWSRTTTDGNLSDFDVEPDPKVWGEVCSERGLCAPKLCGDPSDFAKEHHAICFFQRARNRILLERTHPAGAEAELVPVLAGNRETPVDGEGWVGPAQRAPRNLLESTVPFAALVLVVHAAGISNATTVLGAQLFFVARVVYLIVYVTGIPWLRTLVWTAGLVGMLMILSQVV